MPLVPYVIEQTSRGERTYDVYSRLLKERIIFLGSAIDSEVANVIVAQLLLLQSQSADQPVQLFINSPGGSVDAGLAIYDTMLFITAPVHTTCIGLAASMGSLLLMAGEHGQRNALPHSRVMIHQPHIYGGGISGQVTDIEIEARELVRTKQVFLEIMSRHSGKSFEQVGEDVERNYYMSAEDAKNYGLIDTVIAPKDAVLTLNRGKKSKGDKAG